MGVGAAHEKECRGKNGAKIRVREAGAYFAGGEKNQGNRCGGPASTRRSKRMNVR